MAIRLLGSVQIDTPAGSVVPPAGRAATLLALLATSPGRVVGLDRIMDQLWADGPPASGRSTLYAYVSRLRSLLEGTGLQIVARAPGYLLEAGRGDVDLHVFADRVATAEDAAAAGDWTRVGACAAEAMDLWRGTPFTGSIACDDLANEGQRLARLVDRADELSARSLLVAGRADEAARLARDLVERDPLDESVRRLSMEAQHAAGDTAAALATYEAFRRQLADELGIDPGEAIRALHLRILRDDERPPVATAAVSRLPAGRIAERALLDACVRAALDGDGRMVLLEGDPGIGKTRLAEYAADLAGVVGLQVVWARAIEGAGTPPLWVWEQVLGAATMAEYAVAEDDAAAEQVRFRLFERIVGHVLSAAAQRPSLLVLDDLQWADAGTLQTLQLLAQRLRGVGCSVVATARPHRTAGPWSLVALGREPAVDHVRLGPLSPDEMADLVAMGPRAADATALWERCGGNPFYAQEILRQGSDGVPAGIGDLLEQRWRALPDETVAVLELAAVAGRAIDPVLVARAVGTTVAETVAALDGARTEGLVTRDPTSSTLSFAHDLAREALLERLLVPRRTELHGRIADAYAQLAAEGVAEAIDDLAHHRFEAAAGDPSLLAAEACIAAADHAASRRAYDQATLHRSRAVTLLPTSREHWPARFEALLRLTEERRLAGDIMRANTSLRQAIDLARRMDDPALVRRAVSILGGVTLWNWRHFDQVDRDIVHLLESLLDGAGLSDDERAQLLGTLAVELYYGDDPRRTVDLAEQAVATARTTGDPGLMSRTLNNLVIAAWTPGHDDRRLAALDESLALVGGGLPATTEIVALLHRGALHLQSADTLAFERDLARAVHLAPRMGRPDLIAQTMAARAGLAALRGEVDVAREAAEESHRVLASTSLWGGDWVRSVSEVHHARLAGTIAGVAEALVARASQDGSRMLRWTALQVVAEAGALAEARALQVRWGLTGMPRRSYWGSPYEWIQAAEVALLLGTPSPREASAWLATLDRPLIVIGTAIAVHGPVDVVRARLAAELGDDAAAATHSAAAADLTARVTRDLGVVPVWPLLLPDAIRAPAAR